MDVKNHEYIIIGAGPAGLQLGHHLAKQGRSVIILERASHPGAFFSTFPRHRKLISINKVHTGYDDPEINLRWDWNSLLEDGDRQIRFSSYTKRYFPAAEDLVRYLHDYAQRHELPVAYGQDAVSISRPGPFQVTTAAGRRYCAPVLIMATGVSIPYIPTIPGIEYAKRYATIPTDPEPFCGKRVLIIGKGNSAFETADSLIECAATIHLASQNPLKMAWSTHFVGHLRAVNNNILDTYQLKSQNAVLDATVESIEKQGDKLRVRFGYAHAEGESEEIEYDEVIACTGFRFDASRFAPECAPALMIADRFPALTAGWQSINVPDLYFAGTLTQSRDFKRYTSGFIHGFRYNTRSLSRLLEQRYFGTPYPARRLRLATAAILEAMLERVNRTSSLWQQPGFLCDSYELSGHHVTATIQEDLPTDLAIEQIAPSGRDYFLLTLEFGVQKYDYPFSVKRVARDNVDRAAASNFLHPVVRHYRGSACLTEHHVIEDLAAEWREPEHIEPLRRFLDDVLRSLTVAEAATEQGTGTCL